MQSFHSSPRRSGYTLVEIMVVVGIIVLIIAIGVPLLGVFSGARSVESAQNQLAALVNSARNEAISMQRVTGILFYRDPASLDRVSVLTVYASTPQHGDIADVVYLDTFSDRDPVTLPVGISAQVVNNASVVGGVRKSDGYIGFNSLPANKSVDPPALGGVLLFDGHGRLAFLQYGFRMGITSGKDRVSTALARIVYLPEGIPKDCPDLVPPLDRDGNPLLSQVGFVLFNAEQFRTIADSGGIVGDTDPAIQGGGYTKEEYDEEAWIDDNSVPFMINRYNGTLVRGE